MWRHLAARPVPSSNERDLRLDSALEPLFVIMTSEGDAVELCYVHTLGTGEGGTA